MQNECFKMYSFTIAASLQSEPIKPDNLRIYNEIDFFCHTK
jgi:hypothetical protein